MSNGAYMPYRLEARVWDNAVLGALPTVNDAHLHKRSVLAYSHKRASLDSSMPTDCPLKLGLHVYHIYVL